MKDKDRLRSRQFDCACKVVFQEFRTEKRKWSISETRSIVEGILKIKNLFQIKWEKLHREQLKEEERIMLIDTIGLPQMQAENPSDGNHGEKKRLVVVFAMVMWLQCNVKGHFFVCIMYS